MNNAVYYHAAYAVTATVYLLYAGTLWWRHRALAERERRLADRAPARGERA